MMREKQTLARIEILANVPSATLAQLEHSCTWGRFEPGAPIIGYQDTGDDVFFIVEGYVRVTIYSLEGKAVSFNELGPGEMFGEYPAIDGGGRSAGVEAHTECLIASMSSSAFLFLLRSEPLVAIALLRKLVETVRRLTTRVYEFSTFAVNNRIQAELLRLARVSNPEAHVVKISPSPTHFEIASRISTHREAVTRELNRLAKLGIVERCDGALMVKDVKRLAKLVQEASGE